MCVLGCEDCQPPSSKCFGLDTAVASVYIVIPQLQYPTLRLQMKNLNKAWDFAQDHMATELEGMGSRPPEYNVRSALVCLAHCSQSD